MHYFNLVRLFGDVPLVLHDLASLNLGTLIVDRKPKNSVYIQIIADFYSATLLPDNYTGINVGRVTSAAAPALLAKVYVTRHDWTNEKIELEKVITMEQALLTQQVIMGSTYFLSLKTLFSHQLKMEKSIFFRTV